MVLGSLLVSFSFSLSNLHTILHRGCYQFTSRALVQEASLFSTSWAALGVCIVFDDGHSDWRRRQWHPKSGTLAWEVPWMEEPGGLQSMGSRRVGHN